MTRLYKSKSSISINVVMPDGWNRYVSFMPSTDGGSLYRTDDEEEMWAIEHNAWFGKLFFLVDVIDDEQEPEREDDATAEAESVYEVPVKDLAEAKDYLADKYGVSRTMLRGEKSIMAQAEARGVRFVFPE